jgi:CHAT domain-containing protein/peptidoglycan hydrolase-like protein with peptidoglycan-binding domain
VIPRYLLALLVAVVPSWASAQAPALTLAERFLVQDRLIALGHLEGYSDGQFGPKTRSAIEAYQSSLAVQATGELAEDELSKLLAPVPRSQFQLFDNLDLPGYDYRDGMSDPALRGIGLDVCQASCAADLQCKAFTYNTSARVCFLKREAGGEATFSGAISGRRIDMMSATTRVAAPMSFQRLTDQDLPQNDYRSGLGDPTLKGIPLEACESRCLSDNQCSAYTYNSSARVCFLKSDASSPVAFAGAYSGIKQFGPTPRQSGWVTDPTQLLAWAKRTAFDYAAPPVPIELPDPSEFTRDPRSSDEPVQLDPLEHAVEVRLRPTGAWSILAWRGGNIISLETDALSFGTEYDLWASDLAAWRGSLSVDGTAVAALEQSLEGMIDDVEAKFGHGNPLAGYLKLDLLTVLDTKSNLARADQQDTQHLDQRRDDLLRKAIADLDRPYVGSSHLASILYRRAAAALGRLAKPPENCEAKPDQFSSDLHRRVAVLLHKAGGSDAWVADAMHNAATCALPPDKPSLFAATAAIASNDDVLQARALMDLGTALAAVGDESGARAAFLAGLSLREGYAYADAFPWMRVWFEQEHLLKRLSLDRELDVVLAHRIIQALEEGPQRSTSELSAYLHLGSLLERLERFELADMLYAAVSPAWQSGPELPAQLVAAQAIDERDYGHANAMLRRLLELTPVGSDDGLRIQLLAMLAESYQLAGEFAQASNYAAEGVALLANGTVPQTADVLEAIDSLNDVVRTSQADQGADGRSVAAAMAQFAEVLEGACIAGYPVPEIPERVLDEQHARGLFIRDLAPRYAECAHRQFERRFVDSSTSSLLDDVTAIEQYFKVLFATKNTEAAYEDFEKLLAADLRQKEREDDLGWAYERYLSKPNAAVRAAIIESGTEVASGLLDKLVARLDQGLFDEMIDHDRIHDNLPQTILLLKSIGKTESFLALATKLDRARAATQIGVSCFGPICELAIELRSLQADADGVADYSRRLQTGMHLFYGGANTDSKDMDLIMQDAALEAERAMRLNLPAVAFAYYSIAGVDVDAIISDPLPLSSLKKVAAFATALLQTGNNDEAFAVSGHLLEAARDRIAESNLFAGDALLSWSSRLRVALEVYLAAAPRLANTRFEPQVAEDVLFAVQFLQATRTSATVGQLTVRGSNASSDYRRYLDIGRERDALLEQLGVGGAPSEISATIEALLQEQQELSRSIESSDPEFFRFGRLQFAGSQEIISALEQDEAISTVYAGKFGLVRLWLSPSGVTADLIDVSADELAETISDFRRSITASGEMPVRADLGYELFQVMFGHQEGWLSSIDHLIFVPSGPTYGLPLPALLTTEPQQASLSVEDLLTQDVPWLIHQADVAVLPSMAAVAVMRSSWTASSGTYPFLGVGNPAFGLVDPVHGALTPLRETEAEVRYMGALLGANSTRDLLLGDAATKANLHRLPLEQYRLIAFATHGYVADGLTGAREPGLALSGSTLEETLLTSSEVATLNLDADLVILSACSTASSDGSPGAEGLSGLASAFFYAGARGLLVTHWDIPSGPGLELTTTMISARADDEELAWPAALQRSALSMIEQPRTPLHAHPISWAGHFLVTAH